MLYLKCYKWFLPKTEQVRNDFFGYRPCQKPAKHIRPFIKKTFVKNIERTSVFRLLSIIN